MNEDMKRAAARAALNLVTPGAIIGVGTGSTTSFFIEGLRTTGVAGAVASSEDTRRRLLVIGCPVVDLDDIGGTLQVYIDGADQVDPLLRLVKGGGGAMVREKVLSSVADQFACIVDETKVVPALSSERLAVEVIPMARSYVRREIEALGGNAVERPRFLTDNGNVILDVRGLDLSDPETLELTLEALPGVLGCGIFARNRADVVFVGGFDGVHTIERHG